MTGEGIFTFYSEDAKRILTKYEELCCRGTIEVNFVFVDSDDNNQDFDHNDDMMLLKT